MLRPNRGHRREGTMALYTDQGNYPMECPDAYYWRVLGIIVRFEDQPSELWREPVPVVEPAPMSS